MILLKFKKIIKKKLLLFANVQLGINIILAEIFHSRFFTLTLKNNNNFILTLLTSVPRTRSVTRP